MATVNVSEQIRIFSQYERSRYDAFTVVITWFLNEVKNRVAPLGTVSVRAKEAASFAEKILRKPKYDDPVHQFADLCGGRLVVHSRWEMAESDRLIATCLKIITREDKLQVAGVNEFGYGSVHLDVAIGRDFEKNLKAQGITVPGHVAEALKQVRSPRHDGKLIERKAEIQVRTDLQHVWADTLHDLLYKGGIDMPAQLQREANRLAAVLEEASCAIDDLVEKMSSYKVDHGAFMDRKAITGETERLKHLLSSKLGDKAHGKIALRKARLHRSIRDWEPVIELEGYIEKMPQPFKNELSYMVAEALCRQNAGSPAGRKFAQGLKMLRAVARPLEDSQMQADEQDALNEIARKIMTSGDCAIYPALRSMAMAELAHAVFVAGKNIDAAHSSRDLFFQAHLLAPESPYIFARYLHAHVVAEQNRSMVPFMNAQISRSMALCREHAAVGIELPFAHFTQAMLHALCGAIDAALLCVTRGIAASSDTRLIDEEIELFEVLGKALKRKESAFATRILVIIHTLELGKISHVPENERLKKPLQDRLTQMEQSFSQPVLIVAGTCNPELNVTVEQYRSHIEHALENFDGTILCGGTDAGISGIVGDAVTKMRENGREIRLISYWPETLKIDYSKKHPSYDRFVILPETSGFGFEEPVQYWTDLLLAGVDPKSVRVLGVGGGPISLFEYHLATALGASVGIIDGSGRRGSEIVNGEKWWEKAQKGRCFTLPNDKETIWNFLNVTPSELNFSEELIKQYEPAARGLHEHYRKNAIDSSGNKSLKNWEELDNDLKTSTYHQAIYASRILAKHKLEIKPLDSTDAKPVDDLEAQIGEKGLEKLAEMEHGRWNVERLLQGWHYGKIKDVTQKINPNLVPWSAVPEPIKNYDRDPLKKLPEVLRKAGLGIFKAG